MARITRIGAIERKDAKTQRGKAAIKSPWPARRAERRKATARRKMNGREKAQKAQNFWTGWGMDEEWIPNPPKFQRRGKR